MLRLVVSEALLFLNPSRVIYRSARGSSPETPPEGNCQAIAAELNNQLTTFLLCALELRAFLL